MSREPVRVPSDDRRRTFPAFAARPPGSREPFADTWWGEAWLAALERTSMDAGRLARGRTYARAGHVLDVTVTPGRVAALVQGSRPRPYRVEARLRTLTDAQWDLLLATVEAEPDHMAALLDKEMSRTLADSATRAGVPLLPGADDLVPHCSCPDRGHPCKHAAALCYQAARLLDADPFVLLLMRGRGESELLEEFRMRNAARTTRESRRMRTTPAREVLSRGLLPRLPPPLPLPDHPGPAPALPDAPAAVALEVTSLELLAADAAKRAHAALRAGGAPMPPPDLWSDVVRLAAGAPTAGLTRSTRAWYARAAAATGRTPKALTRAVAAWHQGGAEALSVLEDSWNPPAGPFDRARPALAAAGLPRLRPRANRLTDEARGVQLRFGRNGHWYPYAAEPGTPETAEDAWWPEGAPDENPAAALTALLAPEP
ncbi:SWIM zinc finger family protein [Streptomyces sp. B6B3]|uniref:SWIM zinc finger family protein n=1 Tax=Streptomyces sp. B6B3 TaxID=3153570 RepID=UPI00325D6AF8